MDLTIRIVHVSLPHCYCCLQQTDILTPIPAAPGLTEMGTEEVTDGSATKPKKNKKHKHRKHKEADDDDGEERSSSKKKHRSHHKSSRHRRLDQDD